MAKPVLCHHCGVRRVSIHGGDIACSPGCRQGMANARSAAEANLQGAGFARVPGVLNLWEKQGIHISLDQVIHAGFTEVEARFQNALAAIH